jgi:succinoglycan biosynthesis protein ExoM
LVADDGLGIRFDDTFNFSGREDMAFSFDAFLKGAKLGFAPKAIILEKFPSQRSTFKYLLRRWFDTGLSNVMVAKHYKFPILWRTIERILFVPFGLVLTPIAAICSPIKSAEIFLKLVEAFGWFSGLFGESSTYYRKRRD